MIIDIIFIQGNEKFQITGKELSNENNVIKIEPLTVVLEDIAGAVSDVEIDDRTTPEPMAVSQQPVPMLDDITKIEMQFWTSFFVKAYSGGVNLGGCQADADAAIDHFRESFGISMEEVETPE